MTEYYEKECPVTGPQTPVPFAHLVLRGSVPSKCSNCQYFFEGGCKKVTNRLLRLDYGFCGVEGSKKLVSHPKTSRRIPEKCSSCKYLAEDDLLKLLCGKDSEIWGDFPRGLDY